MQSALNARAFLSGWSRALASLEMFLGPTFHASFLFGPVDATLLKNFILRAHDSL
jgi:hypothetical protein